MPMIEVEAITRTFGRRTALDGVTFRIPAGEAVVLAGPNGAGKTTLLRILSGFIPATRGGARVADCDVFDGPADVRAHVGYVPENAPLYGDMRVGEYLRFRGALRRLPRRSLRRRIEAVSEQCGLTTFRRDLIGALSRGQRVRVALADALLHEPAVLLLDDPLAALDPSQRVHVLQTLQEARGSATLLISTHFPNELAALCSRMLLLNAGRLLHDEPLAGVSAGPDLQTRIVAWLSADTPTPITRP